MIQDEIIKYLHQGLHTSGEAWSLQRLGTRTLISCGYQQWQKPGVDRPSTSDWTGHQKVVGQDLLWWRSWTFTYCDIVRGVQQKKSNVPTFVVNLWYFSALFPAGLPPFFGFHSWRVTPWGSIQSWRTANTASSILLITCQPRKTCSAQGTHNHESKTFPYLPFHLLKVPQFQRYPFARLIVLTPYLTRANTDCKNRIKVSKLWLLSKMCLLFLAVSKRIHKQSRRRRSRRWKPLLTNTGTICNQISPFLFNTDVHVRDVKKTF